MVEFQHKHWLCTIKIVGTGKGSPPHIHTLIDILYWSMKSTKKNRSTEGRSKLKSPETRNVQERLVIRTPASPDMGQEQVSRGASVLCWHAVPVANVLWKPIAIRLKVKFGNKVQISDSVKYWCLINGGCHCIWSSSRMSRNIREKGGGGLYIVWKDPRNDQRTSLETSSFSLSDLYSLFFIYITFGTNGLP